MDIFKLKYESKEAAISDLLEKEILLPGLDFCAPVMAVVDLGHSVSQAATFDENGTELTSAVYDGYCFDVMIEPIVLEVVYKQWDFGNNQIYPETPDHTFAGY